MWHFPPSQTSSNAFFMNSVFSCTVVFFISLIALSQAFATPNPSIPEVGATYAIDKAQYKVVGSSANAFEYTSTGESLEIKILGSLPGTIVITPEKGKIVKVDPSRPMIWIDGTPHKEFVRNTYLKKHAKGKTFLLLEYIR